MDDTYDQNKALIDLNNINKGVPQTDFSDPYSKKRALMTQVASGGEITFDDAYSKITNGQEEETKNYLSRRESIRANSTKEDILSQYIKGKQGQPVTEAEALSIRQLGVSDLETPEKLATAVETNFSRNILNRQIASTSSMMNSYQNAVVKNPEAVDHVLSATEAYVANTKIAERYMEMTKSMAEKQSWLGWGADFGKTMLPGYSWYKKHNLVGPDSGLSNILPGDNLLAQVQYLYSLKPTEFEKQLKAAFDYLSKDNLPLAEDFMRATVSYGSQTKNLDNLFGVLDVVGAGDLAVSGGKLLASGVLKKGTKDITAALINPKSTAADIAAASGDLDTAIAINATKASQLKMTGLGKTEAVQELMGLQGFSIANPEGFFSGASRLSAAAVKEASEELMTSGGTLAKAVTNPLGVARMDRETDMFRSSMDKALNDLRVVHSVDPNNNVIGFNYETNPNTFTRTNTISIEIGDAGKGLYQSQTQAENAARKSYNFKAGDYEIAQQGGGFYIKITRDLDEFADPVRDVIIRPENTNPETLFNMMFGKVRSADGILSITQTQNRKVAVNTAEEVKGFIEEAVKPLGKYLNNKENHVRLERILEGNRADRQWHNTVSDFETAWHQNFGVFPTKQDVVAYGQARLISDLDHTVRNLEVFSYKASRGFMNFEVSAMPHTGNGKVFSSSFEGRLLDELPSNHESYRVMKVDEKGNVSFHMPTRMSSEERAAFKKELKDQGFKLVQSFDAKDEGLMKYRPDNDNLGINFIAAKDFRSARLNIEQLPYVPGGHFNYTNKYHIKQPIITPVMGEGKYLGNAYQGDITLTGSRWQRAITEQHADFEQARKLYAAGSSQLDAFITSKFDFSPSDFKSLFHSNGGFNKDVPFVMLRDGQSYKDTVDLRAKGILDHTESSYDPSSEMRTKYIGEKGKDLHSYSKGSDNNPIWRKEEPNLLDPLRSLRKNMNDITNSVAFNDYKIRSANEWIEQYGDLVSGATQEQLRRNPLWYMNNAEFKTGQGVDQVRLASAKQSLTAINHLMSQPSSVKTAIEVSKDKFLQTLFKISPDKAIKWDEKLMYTTADPLSYMRSAAFHTKIGLFNPAQLFLQAQNLGNMAAISPTHAFGAYKDGTLMYLLAKTENPNVINYWANKSKNPLFKETYSDMKKVGWLNINGNMSVSEALAEPSMMKSKMGEFLDFSSVFFKEGETINRIGAWNIAYREFRAANPAVKELNEIHLREVLNRADNLTTNMSRASNAQLQNGFGSIPLQFMTYQWRVAEQITSGLMGTGGLTRAEAARLMAYNGAAFGIPVGVLGSAAGVWPWHESLEKYAQENGINLDANMISKTFSRGLYEQMFSAMLGKDYALAERFGPGGLPTIKDILDGKQDKSSILDVLGGASYSVTKDMLKMTVPAYHAVASVFAGPEKSRPFTLDDIHDAMRNITTVNNVTKAWMIYNYGTYESRTGVPITGAKGNINEALMQILGVNTREMTKFYSRKTVLDEQRKAVGEVGKLIEQDIGRGLKAEPKDSDQYFQRAKVYLAGAGKISEAQRAEIFAKSIAKFTENDMETINRKWQQMSPTKEILDARTKVREAEINGR